GRVRRPPARLGRQAPLERGAAALRARPALSLAGILDVGVLVIERVEALARDLTLDLALALNLGLAAEPAIGAHVKRLVQDVLLVLLGFAEQVLALGHVDMAGRAGADAAAGVALRCLAHLGGGEDRSAARNLHIPVSPVG